MDIKLEVKIVSPDLIEALNTWLHTFNNINTEEVTKDDSNEQLDIQRATEVKEVTEVTEDKPIENTITLEEVRSKLAALSQNGRQADVKSLITKYGAIKLSDIPKEKYHELLKDVEEI